MIPPFNSAAFYDCDSLVETMSSITPEEAIETYFESIDDISDATTKQVSDALIRTWFEDADIDTITVYGWTRKAVDLTDYADSLADHLLEALCEEPELCGLDGDYSPIEDINRDALIKALETALAPFSTQVKSWSCEPSGSRKYTADEVIKILRNRCPQWFKATATNY